MDVPKPFILLTFFCTILGVSSVLEVPAGARVSEVELTPWSFSPKKSKAVLEGSPYAPRGSFFSSLSPGLSARRWQDTTKGRWHQESVIGPRGLVRVSM